MNLRLVQLLRREGFQERASASNGRAVAHGQGVQHIYLRLRDAELFIDG